MGRHSVDGCRPTRSVGRDDRVEEFFLADLFMVLAGISCTARLTRDCFMHRRRRWVPFVLWLAIIVSVIGVDIHLTKKKKTSSEAKAGEITRLTGEVGNLNGTVQKQSVALKEEQAHTDQHVSDIQDENKQLRTSIDKKDVALVKIAQDQYALNFFPQIVITTNGSNNQMFIQNNGKTNVETYRLVMDGVEVKDAKLLSTIAPTASSSYLIGSSSQDEIARRGATTNARVPMEGTIYLSTLDKRKYKMIFTWYWEVKDGKN
jgi:hypothetical protein